MCIGHASVPPSGSTVTVLPVTSNCARDGANKWSSILLLMLAAVAYARGRSQPSRDWGVISFHLAALHVALSVLLMDIGGANCYACCRKYLWLQR